MIEIVFQLSGDLPALIGRAGLVSSAAGEKADPAVRGRRLREPASLKDALEGLGIPHTEVDLLLVAGRPVSFDYLVGPGDRIEVFPTPPAGTGELPWPEDRLQPRPLSRSRFVCDQHLGKLARLLRIPGFDTLYERDWFESKIASTVAREDRAVLTCSRALLKRNRIGRGRLVRARRADAQAAEVLHHFGLTGEVQLFGHCSLCNGRLAAVPKADVRDRIPPLTWKWRDEYFLCRHCDQLYWEGTHVARLRDRISVILAAAETEA